MKVYVVIFDSSFPYVDQVFLNQKDAVDYVDNIESFRIEEHEVIE